MASAENSHPERGQVLVFTAIVIFVVMGFLALVVDGGILYQERREHQNAVDNGARQARA